MDMWSYIFGGPASAAERPDQLAPPSPGMGAPPSSADAMGPPIPGGTFGPPMSAMAPPTPPGGTFGPPMPPSIGAALAGPANNPTDVGSATSVPGSAPGSNVQGFLKALSGVKVPQPGVVTPGAPRLPQPHQINSNLIQLLAQQGTHTPAVPLSLGRVLGGH